VRHYGLAAAYRQAAAADPAALAASTAILVGVALPMALRWSRVLEALGAPVPVKRTLSAVLVGTFFSQVLPSNIGGDAVRVWEIATRTGMPLPLALGSIAIDRIAGFATLFILLTMLTPIMFTLVAPHIVLAVLLLLAAGYSAVGASMMLDLFHRPLARFRFARALAQFSADMRRVLLSPRHAAPILFYGLVNNVAANLALYILGRGMGLPVSIAGCFVVVPIAAIIAAVPVSIAGWGLREGAFVAGFGLLGMPGGHALLLSVLFGLISAVSALPGGVVWLARRKSDRAVRDAAEPVERTSSG
jgi:uncharacterized protein (TIRG00374 family)